MYSKKVVVAPSGFEPESLAPKASMIDHYTTGLYVGFIPQSFNNFPMR